MLIKVDIQTLNFLKLSVSSPLYFVDGFIKLKNIKCNRMSKRLKETISLSPTGIFITVSLPSLLVTFGISVMNIFES